MRNMVIFLVLVSWSTVVFAQTPPSWEMSETEIKSITNRVTAGRSLQPDSWPNSARVTVMFSFDVDNQTLTIARDRDPSIGAMSQGELAHEPA